MKEHARGESQRPGKRTLSRRAMIATGAASAGIIALRGSLAAGPREAVSPAATLARRQVVGQLARDSGGASPPVRGGTYRLALSGDPPTLDPYGNLSFLTKTFAGYVYSRLFSFRTGADTPWGSVTPQPDLAETTERSPDGLTWTVTLNPRSTFHNIAPVNGRAVVAEDVKFSFQRFTAPTTQNRSVLAYISRIECPDGRTVRFSLNQPRGAFLEDLADTNLLVIIPRESDGMFDMATRPIGSGPWIHEAYEPSVKIRLRRNPSWHAAPAPYFEGVELPIFPEYANRLALFLAGALDSMDVNAADVLAVRAAVPGVNFERRTAQTLSMLFFSGLNPGAIWVRDPRFRHAVSIALDRNRLTEIGYPAKALRDAGIPVPTPWHNLLPAGETRWWVDPRDSSAGGMGASSRYWEYNPTMARLLLRAAGAEGTPIKYQYSANRYGKSFNDIAEAQFQMLLDIGLSATKEIQDYTSQYIVKTFAGNFDGVAFGYETPFSDAGSYFVRMLTNDPLNHGKINDSALSALVSKQSVAFDEAERRGIMAEIQRKHGEQMYYVPSQAGAGTAWTAHQPSLRNWELATRGYGFGTDVAPFRWREP